MLGQGRERFSADKPLPGSLVEYFSCIISSIIRQDSVLRAFTNVQFSWFGKAYRANKLKPSHL